MRKQGFLRRFFPKGQSTAEYAVLLVTVAAALVVMQGYIKRSLQGRLRELSGQIGTTQYDDYRTSSLNTTTAGSFVAYSDLKETNTYLDETITKRGSAVTEHEN